MNRLALCVPAYNAAKYLPRLLRSAHEQTVLFDEILVYDDCSTDDTAAVAAAHGAVVVAGDRNRGCSFGKNSLAEVARSEWVHFHDADDELAPNFVEVAREWMIVNDPPDVVLFGYEYRDNETGSLLGIRQFDDAALRRDPVAYTIREQINPFCGLYRRSSFIEVGGYDLDPEVLYNEDTAMHCRLARSGLRFAADPRITVINYRVGGSMSQTNQIACARAHYCVLKKAADRVDCTYFPLIADGLWANAAVAASLLDWATARSSATLAARLGAATPRNGSRLFRLFAGVSPFGAVRMREWAIRRWRPHLRAGN